MLTAFSIFSCDSLFFFSSVISLSICVYVLHIRTCTHMYVNCIHIFSCDSLISLSLSLSPYNINVHTYTEAQVMRIKNDGSSE